MGWPQIPKSGPRSTRDLEEGSFNLHCRDWGPEKCWGSSTKTAGVKMPGTTSPPMVRLHSLNYILLNKYNNWIPLLRDSKCVLAYYKLWEALKHFSKLPSVWNATPSHFSQCGVPFTISRGKYSIAQSLRNTKESSVRTVLIYLGQGLYTVSGRVVN